MSEELKPCPFCGGNANLKAWSNPSGEFGPGCTNCGVTAESYAAWNTRTQLHSQRGEEVEVVAWRIEHPVSQWKVYEQRQDWAYQQYGHIKYEVQDLMTVAQHQRITAAMAAEVERWERSFRDIHEPALRDAHAYIQELRAELEAIKRQGAVVVPAKLIGATGFFKGVEDGWNAAIDAVMRLNDTHQTVPDEQALVEALHKADDVLAGLTTFTTPLMHLERKYGKDWRITVDRIRTELVAAIAAHRQKQPQ